MAAGPGRWNQSGPSEFPWEQDALDHVRHLMPDTEPYRAWATFSFTAATGHVREVDVLVAVPAGLYVIEIKSHPGRLTNRGGTWLFDAPDRRRTIDNPLHLTDRKAKELKSRLQWAAGRRRMSEPIPFIDAAVFLSAPGLRSELDEQQRIKVYGCNDRTTGLPRIWDDFLGQPPRSERHRLSPALSRQLPRLLQEIGIDAAQAHLRLGRWRLDPQPIDSGPWWQDRLARDEHVRDDQRRARIYLSGFQATTEQRRAVERAAQRGYTVLRGLTHRGITQAVDYAIHEAGPAVLFQHRDTDLPLDRYLDAYGQSLDIGARLDLVRQIAEALDYAHRRHLFHRALAARAVWVSARPDGSRPVLRIGDWEVATKPSDTTSGLGSLEKTNLSGGDVPAATHMYLAPEFAQPDADPLAMDVFGLGAVTHLIVTGKPPAPTRREVGERLRADDGLVLSALADGLPASLDELVWNATHPVPADRIHDTPDVATFLNRLDEVWEELTRPDEDLEEPDPLTIEPGQRIDGEWTVTKVLGTGSTARALLVTRLREPENSSDPEEHRVYKVALDEDKAARLHDEAAVLRRVERDPRIVTLFDGPFTLGRHTVIALEQAGQGSLGQRLRTEGPCTIHELERFGDDLFVALDHLAGEKVWHRDLKPDNLGVRRRRDRSQQLVLFDFSLARTPERDIDAGTRAYLDPFLGEARRPTYDAHAEWYAAAVTLHEMASGERPVWGDGVTNPQYTTDETPTLGAEAFDPALREGLVAFFSRALHRDVERRFTTLREMQDAWRAVFTGLDAQRPPTTAATVGEAAETTEAARDAAAERATRETPLAVAGLSPRAVAAAASLGAQTVGELLDVPPYKVTKVRGVGRTIRSELSRRARQWRSLAPVPAVVRATDPTGAAEVRAASVGYLDDLIASLLAASGRRPAGKAEAVRLMLGLPDRAGTLPDLPLWPKQNEVAEALNTSQVTVSRHLRASVESWVSDQRVTDVRSALIEVLAESGRVMEARELASEVLARWGARADDEATRLAYALAVVRVATEAEAREEEPRLVASRHRGRARSDDRILLALESLDDAGLPSGSELATYAAALGSRADGLAAADPLPAPAAVLRELRAVRAPEGTPTLPDSRLVALAAAASAKAAATARMEIYPTDLSLARALRMTQAAINPGPDGLDLEELLSRLRSRFPALRLDGREPTPRQVETALAEAGFQFVYVDGRFRRKTPTPTLSALTPSTSLPAYRAPIPGEAGRAIVDRLHSAAERGGFLALNVRLKDGPDAAALIAARFDVPTVDVGAEFVTVLRAVAAERDRPWPDVLRADERFSRDGALPRGLAGFVNDTWQRVGDRLTTLSGTVLLHDAGVFARYPGGREVLVDLQRAARSGSGGPTGLWLLCPTAAPRERPVLDSLVIEVLENEWIELPSAVLAGLRAESQVSA